MFNDNYLETSENEVIRNQFSTDNGTLGISKLIRCIECQLYTHSCNICKNFFMSQISSVFSLIARVPFGSYLLDNCRKI